MTPAIKTPCVNSSSAISRFLLANGLTLQTNEYS
jgi:hypothetical protein